MSAKPTGGNQGPSTDRHNEPVVDPTANVLSLVEAANRRQDDLRAKDKEIADIRHGHVELMQELRAVHQREFNTMREDHQRELSAKESARLDSIRQVDREEVAKTAAQANLAIATLAKQTTDLATTLQNTVANTAAAAETRRTADMSEVNKRVSALELASSATAGKSGGSQEAWARVIGLIFLGIAIITFAFRFSIK